VISNRSRIRFTQKSSSLSCLRYRSAIGVMGTTRVSASKVAHLKADGSWNSLRGALVRPNRSELPHDRRYDRLAPRDLGELGLELTHEDFGAGKSIRPARGISGYHSRPLTHTIAAPIPCRPAAAFREPRLLRRPSRAYAVRPAPTLGPKAGPLASFRCGHDFRAAALISRRNFASRSSHFNPYLSL
jgi:hypothetical protein